MREARERRETTIRLDSDKLRTALSSRGLSAARFCEISGVSPNTMTKAIGGRAIATESARKIAKGLAQTPIVAGLTELLAS